MYFFKNLDFDINKGLPVCPFCCAKDYFVLDVHISDKVSIFL